MLLTLLIAATLALAAANGANDNIKGAATLVGSGLVPYRSAIAMATVATAAGGLASAGLASGLIAAFSGKGIVPDAATTSLPFLASVAMAAALTVWTATRIAMPVSTTHALLGGLLGAGIAIMPADVAFAHAARGMLLPLLASPILALALALLLVPLVCRLRSRVSDPPCLCVDPILDTGRPESAIRAARTTFAPLSSPDCRQVPGREVTAFPVAGWLDRGHLLTASAVSFARGLNDTPKIAALMFAGSGLGVGTSSVAVVFAMAAGGLLASRRVADTLAHRVTGMDAGEGLGGNLVTSVLVIGASRLGLPVSTTHVSTGALFGIAARNGSGRFAMIRRILLAWCVTLPISAVLSFLIATTLT